MNRILVICGPTATGKTALGIRLAKKLSTRGRPASGWGGEIVSADSRQVYRGMDIGTGKDLPANSKYQVSSIKYQKLSLGYYLFNEVRVWLLDVVKPNQEFSVAHYVELAQKVIEDIWKRGKLPVIVGGTGFYIKGLVDGIETLGVEPNWELRMNLKDLSAQKLFDFLARLDPSKAASMNASDRKNPRRLVRAIEIASTQQTTNKRKIFKPSVLFIGLKAPSKKLYLRIDKRIDKQVKIGAEEEVRGLIKKGYSWNSPAMSALGYQEWQPYFEGKVTKKEIIQKWKFAEHAYARRQLTWFRKDSRVLWYDVTRRGWQTKVVELVRQWYNPNRSE